MKFVLVGGTGAIGKEIAKVLIKKGHTFSNISRNTEKSRKILPEAANHSDFSEKNYDLTMEIFRDADAVINLAGSSIAASRWTDSYKQEIYNSRIKTTNKIVELLAKFPEKEKVLVSTSAIGIYGNRNDELLDENSKSAGDFLAQVCIDWENAANLAHSKIRVAIPRVGIVLEKNSGALSKMVTPFKFFIGGPLGAGKQWFSWIHISDLAQLYVEMAENDRFVGPFNAVAPNPVQMKEFAKTLGKVLHRPSLFPVPSLALKILLGESASMVLASQRVSSQRLQTKMFKFCFAELEPALQNILT